MRRLFKVIPMMMIMMTFVMPTISHAQLSCDSPPVPFNDPAILENWQTVWALSDICIFEEGLFDEVVSAGIGRDGIPPIDNPTFDGQAAADGWLQPQSPVIAVKVGDVARAYPLAILTRHEIVNDVLGETPIAVTFCPLCNSAIVYDRRVDGEVLRFGVSGFLRNSDLIMWDDKTESWWQQLTGEGIVGTYTGKLLDIVPSQVVGYGAFKAQYPDGEVLSPMGRSYGSNPYVSYDSMAQPPLFTDVLDTRVAAMARVLGANVNDVSVAYPFATLENEFVINDTIADKDVVAFWQPGNVSALDAEYIDDSKDVGMAALFERTLDGQVLTFSISNGDIVDDQTGSTWNVFGTATNGDSVGSQLTQVNAFPHFWFAWAAFYPETEIYGFTPPSEDDITRFELDPIYGNPDAPVTLIEYASFGCSACKYWHEGGFIDDLLDEFDGQVNLIFRDMPLVIPQYDQMSAEIGQCALDQGNEAFWVFHDVMYTIARQGSSTADDIIEMARQAGLDGDALRACYEAGTHMETVRYDVTRGAALGVRSTPTFFVGDQVVFNADPNVLRDLLQAELDELEG